MSANTPTYKAGWRRVKEYLLPRTQPGVMVTHDELMEACLFPQRNAAYYQAVRKASEEIHYKERRLWDNVHNVGYCCIEAVGHPTVAHRRTRAAGHQLRRAVDTLAYCRYDEIPASKRKEMRDQQAQIGRAAVLTRTLEESLRQRRLPEAVNTEETDDNV